MRLEMISVQNLLDDIRLSQVLQELVLAKNLTISELSRRISVPQPTLQRITTGKHTRPHKKTLMAISEYFGISLEQLCGLEPIPWLKQRTSLKINKIPLLDITEVTNERSNIASSEFVVTDLNISKSSFALRMPDESMEPLIQKGSMLIIDPEKAPQYKSFILVTLKNFSAILVRQLIKDANNCYIRALSQDFEQINMIQLSPNDTILGVVVEVRLHCEDI